MNKKIISSLVAGAIAIAPTLTSDAIAKTPQNTTKNTQRTTIVQGSNLVTSQIETSVFNQINKYRASRGLPALKLNSTISQQARIHSQNMARGKVSFSHDGFSTRVSNIRKVVSPYRGAAENVAYNQGYRDPDVQAVKGWLKSSGHHKNIVGGYDLTGIGVAKNAKGEYYFTQIFIRTR
jgi:uncharacterized protein YkwD